MKIQHEFTEEIVCPYCGDALSESYSYSKDSDYDEDFECYSCGKHFIWERHTEITYSSKKKEGDCEHEDVYTSEKGWQHCEECDKYADLIKGDTPLAPLPDWYLKLKETSL